MKHIFTIGYEGASIVDFISTLKSSQISVVLDIREIPLSRRKGFSKQALSQALAASGIDYLHERALGSPKTIRDALHRDKDYKKFFRLFEDYLDTRQALLNDLAERLNDNVALLCYERDPNLCHRLVVAEHLADLTGACITHLGIGNYGPETEKIELLPTNRWIF